MAAQTKRAAIYARVSTDGQTTDNQVSVLRTIADAKGWAMVEPPYIDHAISGAKGREKRPAFDQLCKDAVRRRFDIVMAWSIDRVGRRVKDVATFMSEMEELGVSQYYEKQAIDSSTTYGKGMLHMAAVFAELERDVIRDRVIVGMERAKAKGTKSGKAIGRPKIGSQAEAAIVASLLAGHGILKTAKLCRVSNGPVKRIKAAMANPARPSARPTPTGER